MAWPIKGITDRILPGGVPSFVREVSVVTAASLAGGVISAVITWFQGVPVPFGFAGFVIIALVVSILFLLLVEKIALYRERNTVVFEKLIHLDGAAQVYRTRLPKLSLIEVADMVIKLAANGLIEIKGAKIRGEKDSDSFDYSAATILDKSILINCVPTELSEGSADFRRYGRFILSCDNGARYGMIQIDLRDLVEHM